MPSAAVPLLLTLWDYGLHPLRIRPADPIFSNLFDIQAEAFLRGGLAIPAGSLGIEGFVTTDMSICASDRSRRSCDFRSQHPCSRSTAA